MVLIGRGDQVVYTKAIGNRALVPAVEPMTPDTVFDLASLTKVVATTTSAMMLIEDGRIRLSDRVATFIPGFERYGKGEITIRHLMTHVSGLRPDVDLGDPWKGYDKAIELAIEEVPTSPVNERFVYSDINYFLLGEMIHRVSGKPLDEFARERIFTPLGMRDTGFNPPAALIPRIAPTENCTPYGWPCEGPDRKMLRGIVHDPTSRRMGGVAGHAGLFSTAADLSIFVRMLLNNGSYGGVRILSPLTVGRMLNPSTPPGQPNVRGLGWDMDSSFSSNRGELAATRILRAHRLHRHEPLDRSDDEDVRGVPLQSRPPGRQGRRDTAARAGRDGRGIGADRCAIRGDRRFAMELA